jgi:hypothetical protein
MPSSYANSCESLVLSLSALRSLLNNLLPFRIDLLIVNLTSRLSLLPLALLRRLNADRRAASAADLFLGFFPRSTTIVDRVSGG